MKLTARWAAVLTALAGSTVVVYASRPAGVGASDHNEPQSINSLGVDPFSADDDLAPDAADIYGNYAWPTDDALVVAQMFPAPYYGFGSGYGEGSGQVWDESSPNAYDPTVVYAFRMDRDLGGLVDRNVVDEEVVITARFGYDATRRTWGVSVEGIPGEDGPLVGPVGRPIVGRGGARVQAGLFDEAFFVDLERFFEGLVPGDPARLESATLAFRDDVDFFRGLNAHGIVVEIPKRNVTDRFRRTINVWSTTHRRPGDPQIRQASPCVEE